MNDNVVYIILGFVGLCLTYIISVLTRIAPKILDMYKFAIDLKNHAEKNEHNITGLNREFVDFKELNKQSHKKLHERIDLVEKEVNNIKHKLF